MLVVRCLLVVDVFRMLTTSGCCLLCIVVTCSLVSVFCVLFVVYRILFVVCCMVRVVRCVLCVVCCRSFVVVRCLLCVVCYYCLLFLWRCS